MVAATEKQRYILQAEIREARGSRQSQALRAGGKVPAVIYGLKGGTVAVSLDAPRAETAIHSGAHLVDVSINGQVEHVLIKEVQYDHLQRNIEHVDLLRIDPNQRVRVKIPLDFRGTPKGAKQGGILEVQIAEVELEVLPLEIPDVLRVNVENLDLHEILHAKDIPLSAGAKLLHAADQIIAQVRTVKEEVAVVATEAAATEPEVIGKKAEEEAEAPAAGAAAGAAAAPKAPAKK
ncbi:MAG: 50S ribosomal protein L25 [Phycisphaerae bacterium]|nr:50S ribosomal protein L25 [Phycisphaerae bacterium]